MGTKNNPGQFDCYANALPDEPMFILLGRDPDADPVVLYWAGLRARHIDQCNRPASDEPLVAEARACAIAMRDWRIANDGVWRKPRVEEPNG